ncbi:MAG: sulfur oxidation c-type cytochrome SoxA [Gammaproteobacteria bacterium]|nr:sulfur oxidation c-type cytochrome SoxA [Gammaproteobacteria bacterium]
MRLRTFAAAAVCALAATTVMADKRAADTSPAEDLKTYRDYFQKRFPGVPLNEFGNGVYAIDNVSRDSWNAVEEFPPYEPMIEAGQAIWDARFANGKRLGSCFGGDPAQRGNFPYWDAKRKMVVTLPLAINECLESNGEPPLPYRKGRIADLLAFMSYRSRGQKINVEIPDDPDAIAAYNAGKSFYFARRGQLNFSCAHCHFESAGMNVRTDVLSPALGHTSGWPVYRSKWGELGTLHRRFAGCNRRVRAKPFAAQGTEYRNLEYFLSHVSNGIEYNGPSARK